MKQSRGKKNFLSLVALIGLVFPMYDDCVNVGCKNLAQDTPNPSLTGTLASVQSLLGRDNLSLQSQDEEPASVSKTKRGDSVSLLYQGTYGSKRIATGAGRAR